ncbi:MAG: hypothetical protein E7167_02430 [Firmicutes bacterium]|nr:hypothetical protein [Bacillota bacterium]
MDSGIFINEAITSAINEYLRNKKNPEGIKFNSFFVVIIRLLTIIYDELDILNPFYLDNEVSLDNNLKKYGYPQEDINEFKKTLQRYYENEGENNFLKIQKMLIDMFAKKKIAIKVSETEIERFKSLLYSPYAQNPLLVSYNFLMAKDPFEVIKYFEKQMAENNKKVVSKPKETLNLEAYEILKYSLEDIKAMNSEELDEVNKKVYSYFDINANAINKNYLLDKAVFDHNHPKPAFSTGNGYVDILFFLSIVATLGMVILLITLLVL